MWITIIIIFILVLNVSAVGIFGEAEFVFTSIKLIAIIGLIILSVVIMAGGAPNNDAIGFRYWNNPGGECLVTNIEYRLSIIAHQFKLIKP